MPRVNDFVAERRLDHERWVGESGLIVHMETCVPSFLPRVVSYDLYVKEGGTCVVLVAKKIPWGQSVRRALFGVDEGEFIDLIKSSSCSAQTRAVAKMWANFGTDTVETLGACLCDEMEPEEAWKREGGPTLPVHIAMWNRAIKNAMKRGSKIWVDGAECANADSLDPEALKELVRAGRVLKRGGAIAFKWAVDQCEEAMESRFDDDEMIDDQDAPPSTSGFKADANAAVHAFVDRKKVCTSMYRGARWVSHRPWVMPELERYAVPRRNILNWLADRATPFDLVVCSKYEWMVRYEGDSPVDVRASLLRPEKLVLNGTRTVSAAWCIQHVRMVCVRDWVDVVKKLPYNVKFQHVYYVEEPGAPRCALRECARRGPLSVIDLM